jgi:hypothetical protein
MYSNIQFEVLTSYVHVALEFFIDTGKDTIKALALVLLIQSLIHQILHEPHMRSWFATRNDRNIIFTLEERNMIEIELLIRKDILKARGTTEGNSNPFSRKIDNDTVDKATASRGDVVIVDKNSLYHTVPVSDVAIVCPSQSSAVRVVVLVLELSVPLFSKPRPTKAHKRLHKIQIAEKLRTARSAVS